MRPLKLFDEFLDSGVVRARRPDIFRARSLMEEAEKRKTFIFEVLEKLNLSDKNANYFIENSYDLLLELIRAKLLLDGYYASGEGAHEAEVAYLLELGFKEKDVRFLNELRYYRNGRLYYGKDFDSVYANKVIVFLKLLYPELKKLVKEKLLY